MIIDATQPSAMILRDMFDYIIVERHYAAL